MSAFPNALAPLCAIYVCIEGSPLCPSPSKHASYALLIFFPLRSLAPLSTTIVAQPDMASKKGFTQKEWEKRLNEVVVSKE